MQKLNMAVIAATAVALASMPVLAAKKQPTGDNPIPEITEAALGDEANIAIGKEAWQEQCQHCHGAKAYPGKAPKLRPKSYTPEFVYDRVSYGFRKMPPWNEVYEENELIGIVAWIMSKKFKP